MLNYIWLNFKPRMIYKTKLHGQMSSKARWNREFRSSDAAAASSAASAPAPAPEAAPSRRVRGKTAAEHWAKKGAMVGGC